MAAQTGLAVSGAKRYQHQRQIGVGGFGVVDACYDTATGQYVAVKTILSPKVHGEAKRLVRELDIMIKLRDQHPNLMTLTDAFMTVPNVEDEEMFDVHLVMPIMRGDLHRFSREYSRLPVPDPVDFYSKVAVVFAFQTAFGLDYLHQSGIVHRDLKPDNVLVNVDVTDVFQSTAVICDFGLARAATPTDTFYICTRQYRPPEVITNTAKGDSTIDMWSLGCVLWELVTGRTLFHLPSSLENGQWVGVKASYQLEELLNIVGTPKPEELATMEASNVKSYLQKTRTRESKLPENFQKYFRLNCDEAEKKLWFDLILSCLTFFPAKRPTAAEVCRHELFRRHDIFYGENVHQFAPIVYKGGATSEVRRENKQKIRDMISKTEFQTTAVPGVTMAATAEGAQATLATDPPPQSPASNHAVAASRAGKMVQFPQLKNDHIKEHYASLSLSNPIEVQKAINAVMAHLHSAQGTESADLRSLLTFYVALLPVPATEEDDIITQDGQQQRKEQEASQVHDD